LNRFEIKRIFV